jgi:hypothetical protein
MYDPEHFIIKSTPIHDSVYAYLKDKKLSPDMIDIIPDTCDLKEFVYILFRVAFPVEQSFYAALNASHEDALEESFTIYINKRN